MMKTSFFAILLFPLFLESVKGKLKQCTQEVKKNKICSVLDEYEDNIPPDPPVITIGIYVQDIVDINESKQTMTFLIDFVVWWKDKRLFTSNGTDESSGSGLDISKHIKDVWVPEVSFSNSVEIEKAKGMKKSDLKKLWYLFEMYNTYGLMQFYETFTTEFTCKMKFDKFPYDQHNCTLNALSLSTNVKILQLYLSSNGTFDKSHTIMLDSSGWPFDVHGNPILSSKSYNGNVTYSLALVQLHLKRNSGQLESLMISFYIPSMAFTIFSKFSFFIKPENVSTNNLICCQACTSSNQFSN